MGCGCGSGSASPPREAPVPVGLAFELVKADGSTETFARLAEAKAAKAGEVGVIRTVRA